MSAMTYKLLRVDPPSQNISFHKVHNPGACVSDDSNDGPGRCACSAGWLNGDCSWPARLEFAAPAISLLLTSDINKQASKNQSA